MKIAEAAIKYGIPRYKIYYWKKSGLLDYSGAELSLLDVSRIRFLAHCDQNGIQPGRLRSVLQSRHFQLSVEQRQTQKEFWHSILQMSHQSGDLLLPEEGGLLLPESGQWFLKFPEEQIDDEAHPGKLHSLYAGKNQAGGDAGVSEEVVRLEADYFLTLGDSTPAQSKKILQRILELRPEHSGALIELGNLAFEGDKLDKARDFYERAIKGDPDCVEALYNLANIYFRQDEYAVAIRYFHRCIDLDPLFPEPYFNLGMLYLKIAYREQAVTLFKIYLEVDPESHWADQARELIADLEVKMPGKLEDPLFPD